MTITRTSKYPYLWRGRYLYRTRRTVIWTDGDFMRHVYRHLSWFEGAVDGLFVKVAKLIYGNKI